MAGGLVGEALRSQSAMAPSSPAPLLFTTWNVAGLDDRRLDERSEAQCLALLLRDPAPDVISLQEVVRRSWHGHFKHHLRAAGYTVVPADPTDTGSEYFSLLAVRGAPTLAESVPLKGSRMGRRLVRAVVDGWLFLGLHAESERAGSAERIRQCTRVVERLLAHDGPAVFGGDTNLRIEEEPDIEGLDGLTDAWVAAGSAKLDRATWRMGRYSARYDRVWSNARARPLDFVVRHELGELSDHLPIDVRFAREG